MNRCRALERPSRTRPRLRSFTRLVAASAVLVGVLIESPLTSGAVIRSVPVAPNCPWLAQARAQSRTPAQLAQGVVARMSLSQKANFVVLEPANHGQITNTNVAIPSLCLPALTLVDGTSGIGDNAHNVTQLPSELAVAASFDTALAHSVGLVQGAESRTKGFNVVQAPDLNLARVPLDGRNFETFGEDPFLTGAMGAADITGIQSNGVLALAKHLGVYTQETARPGLNQLVSDAAMAELYNPPVQAAVQQGHVAGIMCAYGLINGVNTCQDPALYAALASWGFAGIVRSDFQSVLDPAAAFGAGMSMIKPYSASQVIDLVRFREMPMATLNRAVATVLATMFAGGLITHPIPL